METLTLTAGRALEFRPGHEPFAAHLRADLFRYFVYQPSLSLPGRIAVCLSVEGIWATFAYRMGRSLRSRRSLPLIGPLAWALFRILEALVRIATGIYLDVEATIGPGFYIGHHGSICVGAGARIGRNSSIGQMCLVSASGDGGRAPVLGERVYLGPGSKVLGPITIGDGAAVGANSVVVADVPNNGVVIGVPARLIGWGGSDAYINLGAKAQGSPATNCAG
ncbi:MAG: serine O-acetyltransferase [Myxococcales bacterium]